MRRRTIVGGLIAVAIALMLMISMSGGTPVEMGSPSVMIVYEYITEEAKTRLADEYTVDMPISGTLDRIALEVGDVVKKGQVVARVDSYDLEQRIKEIGALISETEAHVSGVDVAKPKQEDLESAEIRVGEMKDALEIARKSRAVSAFNLREAENDRDRAKALLEAGAASQDYFDDAELHFNGLSEDFKRTELEEQNAQKALNLAQLAQQRLTRSVDDNEYMRDAYLAQIEGLRAQLAILKNDLGKAEVRSPVTGPVLEKHIEDRRVLAAGTPVLMLGDLESIEIECDVLSEEIGRVRVGNAVEISGKALQGRTVSGTVKRIYPSGFMKISSLGIEQQRVRALIDFDNEEAKLRPGTRVDVDIITAESPDTIAVPDRAAFRKEGAWYVFVVNANKAHLMPVEIGLRNDDWVEIKSGLSADDTIITEPKNDLQDGAKVSSLD